MSKNSKQLDIDDARRLNAAVGWLGLGDFVSANEELDEVSPEMRAHPTVLTMRSKIYMAAKKWDMAVEILNTLTKAMPDNPEFWLHLAYCVRRKTGGTLTEACDILLGVELRFPSEHLFAFNLACYFSQLHQFEEAQRWFKKAMAINADKVKAMALEDEDLKPLWDSMSGTLWKRE